MACNEPIEQLTGTSDGSLDQLTCNHAGQLGLLTCCDANPAQEQELVRRWKQERRNLFSTSPIPFGFASFSTGFGTWLSGPPKPGESATSATSPVVVDPAPTSGSSPANPGPSGSIDNINPD